MEIWRDLQGTTTGRFNTQQQTEAEMRVLRGGEHSDHAVRAEQNAANQTNTQRTKAPCNDNWILKDVTLEDRW